MASRFWNPLAVTGCVDNGSGLGRITVSPAITGSGIVTGTTITVAGITGATGCNVTTTATVIDASTIDLDGTTFGGTYISGGSVAGGIWTATNTSNWAASSTATEGSGGQTVPGSSDTVTFDTNSDGGTVVVNTTVTVQSLTTSTFTGTLDFATNDNNVTLSVATAWTDAGTSAHTINMGDGTWTLSGTSGTTINFSGSNMTLNANGSTVSLTGADGQLRINGKTLATLSLGAGRWHIAAGNATVGTLAMAAGAELILAQAQTLTVTNAPALVGTRAAPILLATDISSAPSGSIALGSGTMTLDWGIISTMRVTGGSGATATNTVSYGTLPTGWTINSGPSAGGSGAKIIGG